VGGAVTYPVYDLAKSMIWPSVAVEVIYLTALLIRNTNLGLVIEVSGAVGVLPRGR
jgi:hypothetical protein